VGSVAPISSVRQIAVPAGLAAVPLKELDPADVLPWLPCTLALEVSVVGFTVGSLLKLAQGGLVRTSCHQSSDIPLHVNGLLMAWTEFEVIGDRLAARITDLV
jgi:flagellar motor switch/type III secretory pathway protein FliN